MTIASPRDGRDALLSCRAEVAVCATLADLQPLAAVWRQLEATSETSVFTSFAWAENVVRQLAPRGDHKVVVAVAYQHGRIVALWPLAVRRHGAMHVLTSIGAPFDQYSEVLLANGVEPAPLLDAMLEELRRRHDVDGMLLRKVKIGGALHAHLSRRALVVDDGAKAPQVRINPTQEFDHFLKQISVKTRKNIRNYANRLAQFGDLTHDVFEGSATAEVVRLSYEGRRSWLMEKGYSSEAFRDQRFKPFLDALMQTGAGLNLTGFVLSIGGEPIALQWGFVHAGCYHAFMSCRNPVFEKYSVGRVHLRFIIEACHQRGLDRIDLMVPAIAYKMNWTKETVAVADVVWPWTAKGFVMLGVVEHKVRPVAKRMIASMPEGLRRPIVALLNR